MGSCGAAILTDNGDILALGGKAIPVITGMKSSDVEYDGLLLGLDWMNRQDDAWLTQQCSSENILKLTVQGDCKAVIDQLKAKAEPQKMLDNYIATTQKIGLFVERLAGIGAEPRFRFQHIPREENALCDALCTGVMETMLQFKVQQAIESAQFPKDDGDTPKKKKKKEKKQSSFIDALAVSQRLVRHSLRPNFYREAAAAASGIGDALAIKTIGEWFEDEAKYWPSGQVGDLDTKESRIVEGVLLQIKGCELMGLAKEEKRLRSKNKYLLGKYSGDGTSTLEGVPPGSWSFLSEDGLVEYLDSPYSRIEDEWEPSLRAWHRICYKNLGKENTIDYEQDFWVRKNSSSK